MSAPAESLVDFQKLMRDWARARHTPFGIPIPRFAVPVTRMGFVQVPAAYGTQVLVVSYQARPNWFSILSGLVAGFSGSGTAPFPGDVSFTVDVDRPLGDTVDGYIEKDYDSVPFPVGNFTIGPLWPVEFRHENGETVRLKATPVANMTLGAGNFFVGALVGFEWPSQDWEW